MAKGKRGRPAKSKQLDLIDVGPENEKEIVRVAERYKDAQAERLEALKREVEEKQALLDLIEKADLQPVGGKIRCRCDGYIITVTPRDKLINIKKAKGAKKEVRSEK